MSASERARVSTIGDPTRGLLRKGVVTAGRDISPIVVAPWSDGASVGGLIGVHMLAPIEGPIALKGMASTTPPLPRLI